MRCAAQEQAFGQREVLRPGHLQVLEVVAHEARREAGGLDGAGFVGDLQLRVREAGPQGVAQHAQAEHLRCLRSPHALARHRLAHAFDPVGGLLALPVPDTLKRADAQGRVSETVPREGIWVAQTPQMFRIGLLREALDAGLLRPDLQITDEASAIEAAGLAPRLVRGDHDNLKVTWPEDFALAERLLRARPSPAPAPRGSA